MALRLARRLCRWIVPATREAHSRFAACQYQAGPGYSGLSTEANQVECAVIGGGVVGLAVARSLLQQDREVVLLEAAKSVGTETSSRNSEVIHAGLYYPTESLKAVMCVQGKAMLYKYCEQHGIPHKRLGKLIVATDSRQINALTELVQQAKKNGVHDLEQLDKAAVRELEPELSCIGAVHSPSTGIVDSHRLMESLQGDVEVMGGIISFGSKVVGGDLSGFTKELQVLDVNTGKKTTLIADSVVNSTGLHAWETSHALGVPKTSIPRQFYARGCYFSLQGLSPCSRLVYPLPEDGGLGVHLTLDMNGRARFGPNVEWVQSLDYTVDPQLAEGFETAIRTYYPALPHGSLQPDYAGIRPKVVGPEEAPGDFVIHDHKVHGIWGLVNMYGIESPGLTGALAIGEYVAEMV